MSLTKRGIVGAALATTLVVSGCGSDGADGTETPNTAEVVAISTTVAAPTTTPPPVESAPLADVSVTLTPWTKAEAPIAIATRSGDDDALYVAERTGRIERISIDGDERSTVLDITQEVGAISSEQGLLGFAWDPSGTTLIVSYTDGNANGASVIERYDVPADQLTPPDDPVELLRVEQPAANHNGGNVAFGPDGLLYIGFGDGGGQGDPSNRAQDPDELLGKILRIDVGPTGTYTVPSDNPFATGGGRKEIFMLGVRNPWRFSFDSATGDLWIADVGASAWEEIDVLRAADGGGRGANLGWDQMEGNSPTDEGSEWQPDASYVAPIFVYGRDTGSSITGGVVVRDPRLAGLTGAYLYADFASTKLWALRADAASVTDQAALGTADVQPDQVVSFGEGPSDEIYVVSLGGTIWRVDPA